MQCIQSLYCYLNYCIYIEQIFCLLAKIIRKLVNVGIMFSTQRQFYDLKFLSRHFTILGGITVITCKWQFSSRENNFSTVCVSLHCYSTCSCFLTRSFFCASVMRSSSLRWLVTPSLNSSALASAFVSSCSSCSGAGGVVMAVFNSSLVFSRSSCADRACKEHTCILRGISRY